MSARRSRRATTAALAALVALVFLLDLLRAHVGTGLRPWQWAAALGAVAALRAWRGARGHRFRDDLPLLALALFLVPTVVDHARRLESDGIHYYSYLRSSLFDGDLQLANDYALLETDPTGAGVLPIGAPLLWSPFVLVVHLGVQVARLFGALRPTGVEAHYQAVVCLATLVYGAAGLWMLIGVLRRWAEVPAAFWAGILCWLGSPLRFYLAVLPGLAHGVEFFAAVLVLRAYLALRDRPDRRSAAWAGAACGLAFLTRPQDGLFLLLPAIEILLVLWRSRSLRPAVGNLLALGAGFAVAALPQIAVWQAMFGVPFLIPHKTLHGAAFLHLAQPELVGTLFSPRGGLFSNYPAMLAAFLGLLLLLRRDGRYVAAVLPVLLAAWYVNSTVFDWYQVRRFTGAVPLLAPGLALVMAPVARRSWLGPAVLAFAVLRFDLAVDRLRRLPGDPVTTRAALQEMGDALAGDAYRLVEPPAPGLAVALLRAYTGEGAGSDGVQRLDLPSAALRLPEPARSLSAPTVEDGVACRWVNDTEARLFFPLDWKGGARLTVHARALETNKPQFVEAVWNEVPLAHLEMTPAWQDYRFSVPASVLRRGTNVLVLRFDRAPIFRRARGEGPKEVRPAAIERVSLAPANED